MEMTLSAIKAYVAAQALPALLAHRWWMVAVILAVTALLGRRVYCRFVCPLGILQSLFGIFNRRRRVCSRLDAAMWSGWRGNVALVFRLVLLLAVIALGVVGLGWQWLDPYAIACRALALVLAPEFEFKVVLFAVVPLVVVLVLVVVCGGRVWCNSVCPVGTVLSLVGIRPWRGDRVKKCSGCDKCGRCFK